jgi:exopolysaccharide production protein ExoZ
MQMTSISPDAKGGTIHGLQALRMIAATMVVLTHSLNRGADAFPNGGIGRQQFLESGVDIFFVISGFIMVYILKPDSKPLAFWLQRFTRIAPLYWAATAFAVFLGYVAPRYGFGTPSWDYTLKSVLFFPTGSDMWAHPVVQPGWTLVYEFLFYTILSLCLLLGRRPFFAATIVIVLILTTGAIFAKTWGPLGFYSDQVMMLEFLFGMGVAGLLKDVKVNAWAGIGLAVIGFVLMYTLWYMDKLGWPRGLRVGMPAFLIVTGFLISEPIWARHALLRRFSILGDASYSIYIVHYFLVQAIARFFEDYPSLKPMVGPYVYTVLLIVAGIGAGLLAHVFIEKPLLKLVRGWLPRRERQPALAAAKV